jgi:hypothetical protein
MLSYQKEGHHQDAVIDARLYVGQTPISSGGCVH